MVLERTERYWILDQAPPREHVSAPACVFFGTPPSKQQPVVIGAGAVRVDDGDGAGAMGVAVEGHRGRAAVLGGGPTVPQFAPVRIGKVVSFDEIGGELVVVAVPAPHAESLGRAAGHAGP